jgi:hypothetical protein
MSELSETVTLMYLEELVTSELASEIVKLVLMPLLAVERSVNERLLATGVPVMSDSTRQIAAEVSPVIGMLGSSTDVDLGYTSNTSGVIASTEGGGGVSSSHLANR